MYKILPKMGIRSYNIFTYECKPFIRLKIYDYPDLMRMNEDCVQFAKDFMETGKPVAAICHGPQLLIETGLLKGRKMTSYPAIKTDLKNAGADWRDKEVVVDDNLITSHFFNRVSYNS